MLNLVFLEHPSFEDMGMKMKIKMVMLTRYAAPEDDFHGVYLSTLPPTASFYALLFILPSPSKLQCLLVLYRPSSDLPLYLEEYDYQVQTA